MKTQKTLAVFASTLLLATAAFAAAEKVGFDQGTGSVAFHAVGRPSAIKINGTGAAPKGAITWGSDGKVAGELTLDISSLDTGISMRTNHMKEKYLEVDKFPQSKLALTEVSLPATDFGKDFSESSVPFKGTLTLHGVSKPVTGTAKIEQKGKNVSVHAEFTIKISDYAIAIPVFAGITVADEVSLVVEAAAPASQQ
jgi:polyisoprenoid-binding protein YceI